MALTPDDVVTKQFQHVRFKEGFDPDEVDDFLDEIVVEWRKTIAENDELKAKLAAYESGAEAPAAAPPPRSSKRLLHPRPPRQASDARPGRRRARRRQRRHHRARPAPARRARRRGHRPARQAHRRRAVPGRVDRLRGRDEAVAKRSPASTSERASLESRITELRNFERDYRAQLRSYIEGKLRDLETTAARRRVRLRSRPSASRPAFDRPSPPA